MSCVLRRPKQMSTCFFSVRHRPKSGMISPYLMVFLTRFSLLFRRDSSGGLPNVRNGDLYSSSRVGVSGNGGMPASSRIPRIVLALRWFTYLLCSVMTMMVPLLMLPIHGFSFLLSSLSCLSVLHADLIPPKFPLLFGRLSRTCFDI